MRAPSVRVRVVLIAVLACAASGSGLSAARLYPESAAGWTTYAAATEQRIDREAAAPGRFLAMDFTTDAAADRRAVLNGAVIVRPVETLDSRGRAMDVPSALVHH